jgi:hypothetical protein
MATEPLLNGLVHKIENEPSHQALGELVQAVAPVLETNLSKTRRQRLSKALTEAVVRLGAVSPRDTVAVVRDAPATAPRLEAVISMIDRPFDVAQTVEALEALRAPLKQAPAIREALLTRAVREAGDDAAAALLEEAVAWKAPADPSEGDYEANLAALQDRGAEMSALVDRLRADE